MEFKIGESVKVKLRNGSSHKGIIRSIGDEEIVLLSVEGSDFAHFGGSSHIVSFNYKRNVTEIKRIQIPKDISDFLLKIDNKMSKMESLTEQMSALKRKMLKRSDDLRKLDEKFLNLKFKEEGDILTIAKKLSLDVNKKVFNGTSKQVEGMDSMGMSKIVPESPETLKVNLNFTKEYRFLPELTYYNRPGGQEIDVEMTDWELITSKYAPKLKEVEVIFENYDDLKVQRRSLAKEKCYSTSTTRISFTVQVNVDNYYKVRYQLLKDIQNARDWYFGF